MFVFASFLVLPMAAGWVGDTAYNLQAASAWHWCLLVLGLVLILGMAIWAFSMKDSLFLSTRRLEDNPEPAVLGVVVSTLAKEYGFTYDVALQQWMLTKEGAEPLLLPVAQGLSACTEAIKHSNDFKKVGLLMPLLGIQHVQHSVKSVDFFCSQESETLASLLCDFLRACQSSSPFSAAYECVKVTDMNDVEGCRQSLQNWLKKKRKAKYADDDIVLDVTGGPKPMSIVMALITLDNRIHLQYVNNQHQVLGAALQAQKMG